MKPALTAFLLAAALASASCAYDTRSGKVVMVDFQGRSDPCANIMADWLTIVGGGIGGVLGYQVKGRYHDLATVLGAGAGAIGGRMLGADIDRRRCELSKIQARYQIEMEVEDVKLAAADEPPRSEGGAAGMVRVGYLQTAAEPPAPAVAGLRVTLRDRDVGGHFNTGSADVLPRARQYFTEIARQLVLDEQTLSKVPADERAATRAAFAGRRVFLLGHTDDTGDTRLNAALSERRARAVADIFRAAGLRPDQLYYQGAGETQPIADNRTADGRARNRRVEIVDLPNEASFQRFLDTRRPATRFYRPAIEASSAPAVASGGGPATSAPPPAIPRAPLPQQTPPVVAGADRPATPASPSPGGASPAPLDAKSRIAAWDFGGDPLAGAQVAVNIGSVSKDNAVLAFLISQARAVEAPTQTCASDRPRASHGVKSLRDDRNIAVREYLPGFAQATWISVLNGHLLTLSGVAVLRDGNAPPRRPELRIYRDYKQEQAGAVEPDVLQTPDVNVYRGDRATLYRVFAEAAVRCVDLVVPHQASQPESWLFYQRGDQMFVRQAQLARVRS